MKLPAQIITLFLLFLVLETSIFASETGPEKEKQNASGRFSIGLKLSLNLAYKTVKSSDKNHFRNKYFEPTILNSEGLLVHYQVRNRLSLETGCNLLGLGEELIRMKNFVPDNDPMIYPTYKEKLRYYYFELPFKPNYTLSDGKYNWYIGEGLSFAHRFMYRSILLVERNLEVHERLKNDNPIDKLNNAILGLLSTGLKKSIHKSGDLRLEVLFGHGFNSMLKDSIFLPYTAGLNLAYLYRLYK